MPNITTNYLTVRGPKEKIAEFLERSNRVPDYYTEYGLGDDHDDSESSFTFSGLCPYPQEVLEADKNNLPIHLKDLRDWEDACCKILVSSARNCGCRH